MEISEGNKLIAEFMGLVYRNGYNYTGWYKSTTTEKFAYIICDTERLKYHSSWDWLMPVIEKIEGMSNYIRNKKIYSYDFTFIEDSKDVNVEFKIQGKNVSLFVFEYMQYDEYMHTIYFQFNSLNVTEINKIDPKQWRTKIENCWITIVAFIKWYNTNGKGRN